MSRCLVSQRSVALRLQKLHWYQAHCHFHRKLAAVSHYNTPLHLRLVVTIYSIPTWNLFLDSINGHG